MSGPRIALCMIARDEEAMLGACLASVAGVVDDIVVVDTGSRDRTVEIAKAAGARIVPHVWQDDFAAARNVSIRATDCDWVLVLDADERLTPQAASRLRAVVADAEFQCGLLPLHEATQVDCDFDAVVAGHERSIDVAYLPRLLRNVAELAFSGIIHESPAPWLLESGGEARVVHGLDIIHLGGVPSIREQRSKSDRNIRLLERYVEEHPGDLLPYGYLAHEYLEAGQNDRARDIAERGWPLMSSSRINYDVAALRLASARAWLQVQSHDGDGALASVALGERHVGEHPDLLFIRGCAHETVAFATSSAPAREIALGRAVDGYSAALALGDRVFLQKFVKGCSDWAALTRRATLRMLQGSFDAAREDFDRALTLRPDHHEAAWGRLECMLWQGEISEALAVVQSKLTAPGPGTERPDGWVLAALTAEAAGQYESMAKFISKAQHTLTEGFMSPHRRERYHDALMALSIYSGASGEAPGPIGQLAVLLQGRYEEVTGGRARPTDWAMVDRLLRHLLRAGRKNALLPLLEPRAEALLPGLAAQIRTTLDTIGGAA